MGRRLPIEGSGILTPNRVATLVGRHRETVTLALRNKELKGKQRSVGGFWYVRREDALEWALGEDDETDSE